MYYIINFGVSFKEDIKSVKKLKPFHFKSFWWMILHPSTDVRINLKYPLLKTKRNNQFMPNRILNACHTIFNSRLDFCVGVKKRFGLCSWIEKNSGILSSSQGIALKCLTVIACRVSHNSIYVWIIATLSKWISIFFYVIKSF